MTPRRPGRGDRSANALRELERRIAALVRDHGEESLELASALSERAELLESLDEDEEALLQLDGLIDVLEGLDGREATGHRLLAALAQRIQLLRGDGGSPERALSDTERALDLLAGLGNGGDRALLELDVELRVHRGHLLVVAEQDGAAEVLRSAVERADALETPNAAVLRARARRELAVARAQDDLISGLSELEQAEALFGHPEVPRSERALLLSTRAEMLANAGRFDDALAALSRAEEEEDWVLAQQAATLDLAGREEEAAAVGRRLADRLRTELDAEDGESVVQLAEVLLAQARRTNDDDERRQQAGESIQLLEGLDAPSLRAVRLLSRTLEVYAAALDPAEAHQALSRRAHLLERLHRERGEEEDRTELVRSYLLDGDALMRGAQPREARRAYRAAIAELEAWSPSHRVVIGLLPLAWNALAQSLGAAGLWLSARRTADRAVASVSELATTSTLGEFGEVFLFQAVACVNLGTPERAVEGLRRAIALLLGAALTPGEKESVPASLVETVIDLCVLQAEVLVDHLDRVDEAVQSYDQALALCALGEGLPEVEGAILGAKAAMLNERERPGDAVPLLERCIELYADGHQRDHGPGELAYTLVRLASSLNRMGEPRTALGKIQEADGLLTSGERPEDAPERRRRLAIRSQLYHQRGEALLGVGHPLLASDEFTRAIEIYRELADGDDDIRHEARQRLPFALLRRARSWLRAGEHDRDAGADLAEARRLYQSLVEDEGRPEHRRRLDEVEGLAREVEEPGRAPGTSGDDGPAGSA